MLLKNLNFALRVLVAAMLAFISGTALAVDLNMPMGVTPIGQAVYGLHMYAFWVCVGIGIVVFGLMIVSIIWHRKAAGHQAAQFHDNTVLEVIWTIIPFIILIALAIPSAKILVKMTDTSDSDMSIKIEGYQWKWQYDYLQDGFSYFSTLAADSNAARQLDSGINPESIPHYLRDVDHPMVVPTDTKIRLLITSNDVIHSWWVPDFGVKMDAIPGFVNQVWIKVDQPGTYRGSCSQLCGRGHAFMPIVVVAENRDDYQKWIAAMKTGNGAYIDPASMQSEQTGSPVVYAPAVLNINTNTSAQLQPTASVLPAAAPTAQAQSPTTVAEPSVQKMAGIEKTLTLAEAMARGKQVFDTNCAACHMTNGKGNPEIGAPAIAGGPIPNGPVAAHISLVLHGKGIMPAWGKVLNDADLAAVITYERNAFGNHKGDVVQPAQIKAAR